MSSDELLNKLTTEYVENMAQVFELSQFLEKTMSDGRINISKARYCMGSHDRVSALCYNESDLSAPASVQILVEQDTLPLCKEEDDEDPTSYPQFTLSIQPHEQPQSKVVDEMDEMNTSGDNETNKPKSNSTRSNDPIHWFGILVPRSLRSAQQDFKRCLPLVCELVSRRSKLAALKDAIRKLVDDQLAQDLDLKATLASVGE